MDAIKIAFETILVGAMALPWLFLVLLLFFPEAEGELRSLILVEGGIQYAIVSVLAIAMGYTLGAAAARLAQDFFDDDDLGLSLPTEDTIRASVYCDVTDPGWLSRISVALPRENGDLTLAALCASYASPQAADRTLATRGIKEMFKLQESMILLKGENNTSQLRHLHQQLMVLRGVAFNGLITCLLCLFAWNAGQENWGSWRRILPLVLLLYLFFYALVWKHLEIRGISQLFHPHLSPDDPPFMECAGLMLALAGLYLATRHTPPRASPTPRGSEIVLKTDMRTFYGTGFIVAALLTAVSYGGWYWTEVLYDRMVIDSYYAIHYLLK